MNLGNGVGVEALGHHRFRFLLKRNLAHFLIHAVDLEVAAAVKIVNAGSAAARVVERKRGFGRGEGIVLSR